MAQNAGKYCVCIDLEKTQGQGIALKLIAGADVVVENRRPGVMDEMGLGYEDAVEVNPTIIYASISGYGATGPDAGRPAFDDIIQGTSGFMCTNPTSEGPGRAGGPVLDYATGLQGVTAVMAALMTREQSGESQHLDIAMQDTAMALMSRLVTETANTGRLGSFSGNRSGVAAGRFATADGFVMLAAYMPPQLRRLVEVLGLEKYTALSDRDLMKSGDELTAAIEECLLAKTSENWDGIFVADGVIGGAVRDMSQTLATGQPEARGFLSEIETPLGPYQVPALGFVWNGESIGPTRSVSNLGEDTRSILTQIGYDSAAIDAFIKDGVVSTSA
jgi:crotonobetainyl-CoA:carnitine CoA-transferase CaiB-like acyl-CoA transferase